MLRTFIVMLTIAILYTVGFLILNGSSGKEVCLATDKITGEQFQLISKDPVEIEHLHGVYYKSVNGYLYALRFVINVECTYE